MAAYKPDNRIDYMAVNYIIDYRYLSLSWNVFTFIGIVFWKFKTFAVLPSYIKNAINR